MEVNAMNIEFRTFMFKGKEQTQVTLIADNGMLLTQKQLSEDEQRIYSDKMFLGKNDSADNYIEITEIEAKELQSIEEQKRKEADNGES